MAVKPTIRGVCRSLLLAACMVVTQGCQTVPEGIVPVEGFDAERYMGRWYEIARLDHSFERGLEKVSADYSLKNDGNIDVVNKGYSTEKGIWKEAVGKANFVGASDVGHLKVSFFGPFYSSYVVFHLDHEQYQYAFVSGPSKSYLWLLARTPQVQDEIVDLFVEKCRELGYITDDLIYVNHNGTN